HLLAAVIRRAPLVQSHQHVSPAPDASGGALEAELRGGLNAERIGDDAAAGGLVARLLHVLLADLGGEGEGGVGVWLDVSGDPGLAVERALRGAADVAVGELRGLGDGAEGEDVAVGEGAEKEGLGRPLVAGAVEFGGRRARQIGKTLRREYDV